MPAIEIQLDITEATAGLREFREDQLPYATSVAVNEVVKQMQAAIRKNIEQRMTVRRRWVPEFGVKISRFSEKTDTEIKAVLEVPETHDFLWKFETGETKTPRRSRLAIPRHARSGKAALIPAGYRPRALNLVARSNIKSRIEQVKGDRRTFILDRGKATPGIYQRTGPKRDDIRMLYKFQASAPTPSSLRFYATARETAAARWVPEFRKAFRRAMATARP